jgi:hypothetical protein
VAAFEPEVQDRLLALAEEQSMTRERLREVIREMKETAEIAAGQG